MKLNLKKIFLDKKIKGVSFDSRNVKKNYAFFAIKGEILDGNNYIDDAINNGASIIFTDNISLQSENIIYSQNIREDLASAAEFFYPETPENMVAVTGTNGKSSIVSYVHQILSFLEKESAAIGTLGIESNKALQKNFNAQMGSNLTTSDVVSFRKNLSILKNSGVKYAAFEASSHGLAQKRISGVRVNSAAFVSFSQDHLEYHGTMENYLTSKLILFKDNLVEGGEAVIYSEIDSFDEIISFLKNNNIKYSTVGNNGDLKIVDCKQSLEGQNITFIFNDQKYEFHTKIIGSFQAANLLIAAKLVCNLGISFNSIVKILSQIEAVKGRLQRITNNKSDYQVFVDYAHTPDALKKSLIELQKIKQNPGKLYVIFGCGGDRDPSKRKIMGEVAVQIANHAIVTDDNPRTEDAKQIRDQVINGSNKFEEIADRELAITNMIARLKINDILLIAGKGHENYQIIGKKITKFSDQEVAYNAIKDR